ncbi:MAG: glycosyltransferase [Planctomycetota bacterium]
MKITCKKRILFVLPYYPAIRFTYLYDYILGLSVLNFNVELLALVKEKNESEHSYFKNKCKIYHLDEIFRKLNLLQISISAIVSIILFFDIIRFLLNPAFFKNIIVLVAKFRKKYDFVYSTQNIIAGIYSLFFKKMTVNTKIGFGIFDHYAGIFELSNPEKYIDYRVWINKKLIKIALQKMDFFTAFNQNFYSKIQDLFRRLNISKKINLLIIEPALSFCPVSWNKSSRKEGNIYRVLSITGFEKFKGTLDFLYTFKNFLKSMGNFYFTFIGSGKITKEIEKFIEETKLVDRVKIIRVADRVDIIRQIVLSDFVIHTSYIETGPAVLIESLVCGKPIFIQDVGIARNISSISEGIYIYDSFDDLKNQLINFIKEGKGKEVKISLLFKHNHHFNLVIENLAKIFS